jgi:hypothetical protein
MVLNDVPDDMLQLIRQWREEKVEIENAQAKR